MNTTSNIEQLYDRLKKRDFRALARAISLVENESIGSETLLELLQFDYPTSVIGITGPPGAGKSTMVNQLISRLLMQNKTLAILAVDPSSPFNHGALLGDRIRLNEHYNNPNVFIRSLASRGSLGGLCEKIIEVSDVVRAAGFDYLFIETVGVGQSEVEIAGLADTSIVVLVPEAGDEVQTMKAGLMEIADIFVVNKADRPKAEHFLKNLKYLVHSKTLKNNWSIPVVKTIATKSEGIDELTTKIHEHFEHQHDNHFEKKAWLLAQKAWRLIQKKRMANVSLQQLQLDIQKQLKEKGVVNVYQFLKEHTT